MENEAPTPQADLQKALADLSELRHFSGPPKDFWPRFLAAVQQLTDADNLALVARKAGQPWRRLLDWPRQPLPSKMLTVFFTQLDGLASEAVRGCVVRALDPEAGPAERNFLLGAGLALPQQEECVLTCLLSETSKTAADEAALRLRLACQTPESYQANLAMRQATADVEKFASVLDLTVAVSAQKRFLATGMAFCNGLASRFNCDRVSLGWVERGFIRLRVISRMEKLDPQMSAAKALESAMEEALDQDEEVIWPLPEGATIITRDHERFAKEQKVAHLCSLPLRSGEDPVAVVTCERVTAPFSETELQQLRLSCDLAAPRLVDLQEQDRWFGSRWAGQFRKQSAKLLGPEHTGAKLLALLIMALLAVLFFVRVPYRVEANFQLRSDELAHITAPFDGYIDQVSVRPGDNVAVGAPLLKLKTAELELDESFALADLNRYQREAEKARAARSLAEMRIADAMTDQSKARLDLVRYRIAEAGIKAPFAGVIIEGDLRERLGSPVKMADVLFKVARVDTLYVEAELSERDIHELLGASAGEIAFVSRPREKFPIHIIAIEQAALPKAEGNVFLVRCGLNEGVQSWWRPGMSGVCKFGAGKRPLAWILTHRTVDFLRLKLWW